MKASSIKKYLRPSTIIGRKSTFANAFASALAPHDVYSPELVDAAIRDLGQDPDADLECVYCGREAATWDHVFNRVTKGEFSGHGHRVRNLVPSCRTCNESKGQKPWRDYLDALDPPDKQARIDRMEKFLSSADAQPVGMDDMRHKAHDELERFLEIRKQVFDLMAEADRLAVVIRQKASH
ncbi:HNH endonuclease [Devosia faecipullorum]|uniref:HNH endonuclease n=1 Tax=Devosia faecipullorum TaxID=2755039 RepID=UPI00187BABEF|nr:HNH endonuclease [Devosia faecipullorum]